MDTHGWHIHRLYTDDTRLPTKHTTQSDVTLYTLYTGLNYSRSFSSTSSWQWIRLANGNRLATRATNIGIQKGDLLSTPHPKEILPFLFPSALLDLFSMYKTSAWQDGIVAHRTLANRMKQFDVTHEGGTWFDFLNSDHLLDPAELLNNR